jgi:hypothetical protein
MNETAKAELIAELREGKAEAVRDRVTRGVGTDEPWFMEPGALWCIGASRCGSMR